MYAFRDTTASALGTKQRSAESVKFGGVWLEDRIEGFRVLSTSGRELATGDISTNHNVDHYDFARVEASPRTITVNFQVLTSDDAEYTAAFSILNGYLSAEQSKLIFADEPDKYYIATRAKASLSDSGSYNVTGKIEFYCTDPHKYSMTTSTASQDTDDSGNALNTITIDNTGNVPCPVDWYVDFPTPATEGDADCGYVSLADEYGNYLIFGDQEEQDTIDATKSVHIRARTPALIKNKYTSKIKATMPYAYGTASVKVGTVALGDGVEALIPSSWGTAPTSGYYGPVASVTWTADSATVYCSAHPLFATNNADARGLVCMALNVGSKTIADIALMKRVKGTLAAVGYARLHDADGNFDQQETVEFSVADTEYNPFDPKSDNEGLISIYKDKGKFTFNIGGTEFTMSNSALKSLQPTSVSLWMCRYSKSTDYVANIGIRDAHVRRDSVSYAKDVPNRYTDGDSLVIRGAKGYMKKNGSIHNGDEVLGSTYFTVPPGAHTISFGYSQWCTAPPTLTAKWRARWL